MAETQVDIAIVGGGMIGATLAAALCETGLRIAIIEASDLQASSPSFDARAVALAYSSAQVLQGLGLWPALQALTAPFQSIHVSDRGHFGTTRLSANEQRVPALGYVLEVADLGQLLQQRLDHDTVTWYRPAQLIAVQRQQQGYHLQLKSGDTEQSLQATLVVGADGGQSILRQQMGLDGYQRSYQQDAVITTIATQQPHQGVAYERFTDTGPLAFLPLTQDRISVVWSCQPQQTAELLSLSDAEFCQRLQQRFGYRLGEIQRCGRRVAYPLKLVRSRALVQPGLALVGNAAHTLHPIAGQGFNLGLRDVAWLAQLIVDAQRQGQDWASWALLQQFAQLRQPDHDRTVAMTDGLTRLFTPQWLPLVKARGAALVLMDALSPLKSSLARQAMGLGTTGSRLLQGVPL